jgi:hypothetical protein
MDVRSFTNSISVNRSLHFNDDRTPIKSGEINPLPQKSSFDYDRVMMNMEEVKNLMYVVLGGGSGRVRGTEQLGNLVNRLV